MSGTLADALIQKGSGDAALLLLYLLRHDGYYDPEEAGRTFRWSRTRLDAAMLLLGEMGLETAEPVPEFRATVPDPESAPDYTREEITRAIEGGGDFAILYEQVKRMFNTSSLKDRDTKTLLELYDHLGLPLEVLVLLVQYEVQEYHRKYHSTAKPPPMSYIRAAGYRWKRSGIDTLDAADSYLKRMEYYRSREGEMLAAVGIVGRSAVSEEKKYLDQWLDWGFPPETVAIAYQKTVVHQGKLVWSYCNAILRRWHRENLHKPEEVRLRETPKRPAKNGGTTGTGLQPAQPMTAAQQQQRDRALEENQRQLKELLKRVESGPQ